MARNYFQKSGPVRVLGRFWHDRTGATAIEYALIATGISITILGVVLQLGGDLNSLYFDKVTDGLQ